MKKYYRKYRGMTRNAAKRILKIHSIHYSNVIDLYRALNNNKDNCVIEAAIRTIIDEILIG